MLELLTQIPRDENDLLQFSLDELAKIGAKQILSEALRLEVQEYLQLHRHHVDDNGHRLVVGHGKGKDRKITVGSGTIELKAPRVRDKREGHSFYSKILPRYCRKSPNVETVLPLLYLKGLSGNFFKEALDELLGKDVSGLSAASISALKKDWQRELELWNKRPITSQFVYLWADGVNISIRLGEDKKLCLLVVIGVNEFGKKELLAVDGGFRESANSWKAIFNDLVNRGLNPPHLLIGDGGLGLWAAIKEIEPFKSTKNQRCWVHKIANVLDKLPKKVQSKAKEMLHEMMRSETREDAELALKTFKDTYESRYPKAYECLVNDWNRLTVFFDFPASHWHHIRTTNAIESTFATVKLRTKSTKGAGSLKAGRAMAFKLLREAEKKWHRIRGHEEIRNILRGYIYRDGVLDNSSSNQQVVA